MNNNREFFAELLQVQAELLQVQVQAELEQVQAELEQVQLVPPDFIQAIEAINNNGFGNARACCYLYIYDSDFDWLLGDSDGYINIEAPGGGYYVRWKLCRFQGQLYFIFIFPLNDFSARETSMNEVLNLVANESGRVIDNNNIYHKLQSIRPDIIIPPPDQPDDSLIPLFGNELPPDQFTGVTIVDNNNEDFVTPHHHLAEDENFVTPLPNQFTGVTIVDNNNEDFVTPPHHLAGVSIALFRNESEDFVTPLPNQLAGNNIPNNEDFVTPLPNQLAGNNNLNNEGFVTPLPNHLTTLILDSSNESDEDDVEEAE